MEQREFESLPAKIEELEAELQRLKVAVVAPDFYRELPDAIHQTLARLDEIQNELLQVYELWDGLDSRSK